MNRRVDQMNVLLRKTLWLTLLFISQTLCALAQTPTIEQSENMTNDSEYVPPVEALVPYQSAIASFRRKLPPEETLAFAITISSPAESYAVMIQRELESKTEYGITVTLTPLRNSSTGEVDNWRIFAVSKPLRLGDLTEEQHHAIAGWAFELAGYFQSRLVNFAYRM